MIKWSLEKRKLKELKPHPKNPRQLTADQKRQLDASLAKFGLIEKLIINQDNMIIGGHQRYRLLKLGNEKEVDCWVPDRLLSEEEAEELLVRLNLNQGEFDYDKLANDFNVPDLLDWGFMPEDLELSAFDDEPGIKAEKKKKLKTCPSCGAEF